MHQEYLDSISLYQGYGHPHGFTTITCNPNWQYTRKPEGWRKSPGQTRSGGMCI